MKKTSKALFLTAIILLPILVIWFLYSFGENKFTIPVLYQDAASMNSDLCNFPEGQHYVSDFSFVNQNGESVTSKVFDNQITVVNFFFTSCPTICPNMANELTRVQEYFNDNEHVQILSLSVDPEYDQPEVLKSYAERVRADEKMWMFLTGDKNEIYNLSRCGFLLPLQDGNRVVDNYVHSERFVLVDSKKRIRGYYTGTDIEDVDRLITEMKILLQEEKF